jgi:hypothetical protein
MLRSFNLPISFGISPERLFRLKLLEVREVQLDIEDGISLLRLLAQMLILESKWMKISYGISPVKLFISRDKVCRFFRFPMDRGIFPVILLLERVRIPSVFSEISKGILLEKMLSSTLIYLTIGKVKIPAEIVLLSKFFFIQIFVKDLQSASCSGIGLVKKFFIKINIDNFPPLHKS